MSKITCLIERFLVQLIALEMLCALIAAPIPWNQLLHRDHVVQLPHKVVIQTLPQYGWYALGDCSERNLHVGTRLIRALTSDVCLEGPFSQLYQLRSRMASPAHLKYGYQPLYIY